MTVKSVEGSTAGTGENIGTNNSYGLSGNLRPSYYYQITSNGVGPLNTNKKLITIVSVQY
jgi:hypothetical protein